MRVLLIEARPARRACQSRASPGVGCEVTYARDPLEARAAYDHANFDLAIVDLLDEHLNRDFDSRRPPGLPH